MSWPKTRASITGCSSSSSRTTPKLNVEAPVVTPWITKTPINTPQMVLERNPYCFAVDTAGNQLPYFDKIVMGLAEDLEVLNLRAIAGEYDIQGRHVQLPKLPVLLENQEKGNYTIRFWRALGGSDSAFYINQNYDADPEIGKWLRNKDFRIALSQGFDRDQLNEIFWLGTGDPGSACPAGVYAPGPEWRKKHATFEPETANEILDRIGLDKKDSEGFRLRTDGGGRLVLEAATVGAAFMDFTGITENVAEQLGRNIGIKMVIKEMERSLLFTKVGNNELQMPVWSVGDNDDLFLNAIHTVTQSIRCLSKPFLTGPRRSPSGRRVEAKKGKRPRALPKRCWTCSTRVRECPLRNA